MPAILYQFARLNSLIAGGALITFALFFLMQNLIQTDFAAPSGSEMIRIADITLPELDIEVNRTTPKPDEPDDLEEVPPLEIDQGLRITGGSEGPGVYIEQPVIDIDLGDGAGFFMADTNAVPLVQVQPAYPQRALQREIEGYVVYEFDVDENGMVINPRVLYAEPEGYFETAAARALERYKYQPKIVDGKAMKMFSVQQKFTFTLAD